MRQEIICGDAMDKLKTMSTNSIDMILTDPPYNLSQEVKNALHQEFERVCAGDILVFSPPENQWVFPGVKYLFWVKPTSTKNYSKSYGRFVEMIFLYQRGKTWNTHLNWANYVGIYNDKVLGTGGHSFEKPESLVRRFLEIHSNPGDIICDPFFGSGTVLKIAHTIGRDFVGIEQEKQLCEELKNELYRNRL